MRTIWPQHMHHLLFCGVPLLLTRSSYLCLTLPQSLPAPSRIPGGTANDAPTSFGLDRYNPEPAAPPTDSSYPPARTLNPDAGVVEPAAVEAGAGAVVIGGPYIAGGKCSAADSTIFRKLGVSAQLLFR